MHQLGLNAYWLVHEANVRYLSGFRGGESTLLVTADDAFLITDSRFEEQAAAEAALCEIVSRRGPMAHAVSGLCRRLRVRRLGVTARRLVHADWCALRSRLPQTRIEACDQGIAEALRVRKDRSELAAIKAALRLAEEAFLRLVPTLRAGRTERDFACTLEYEMRMGGADGSAFDTICAVDEHSSQPHAISGERALAPHGTALFDWGARAEGYCSDLTRVLCTDKMPPKIAEAFDVVLSAQVAALAQVRPGVLCKEVDRAARRVIAKAGCGPHFGHASGHGVGLEVHEPPDLRATGEQVLLEGMVLTVEPGIYLPGIGGVRIEDMVVVGQDGCEVISTLPRRPAEILGRTAKGM